MCACLTYKNIEQWIHPVVLEKQAQKDAGEAQQLTSTPFIQFNVQHAATDHDLRQNQITSKLIDYVAETLQPLSTVHRSTIFYQYDWTTESSVSGTIKKAFVFKANNWQNSTALCNATSNVSSISLTLDLWTNRQMGSYLGMTTRFITIGQVYLLRTRQMLQHRGASSRTLASTSC